MTGKETKFAYHKYKIYRHENKEHHLGHKTHHLIGFRNNLVFLYSCKRPDRQYGKT